MTLRSMLHQPLWLTHGWLPIVVQLLAAVALIAAIGWRTRRWRTVWVPWSALVGAGLAAAVYLYIRSADLADDSNPAPLTLWVWLALSGMAVAVLVSGWASAQWWRRCAAVAAVPLAMSAAALGLNVWTGYFPTAQIAWNQLTAGPLPDQTDQVTMAAMQKHRAAPIKGTVIAVDIPSTASRFGHRREFVYLPPAWYSSYPPPVLPTVMMIGGDINTPADWMRAGGAIDTVDTYATHHHGYAPVLVFVDPGGTFDNDTECVNGSRGNSADHLTKDVVPYVESHYRVSADAAHWGIVGWSMGGTCAVDLAVMHPDMFSAFEDIAGDLVPNAGNQQETIDRLFGGNAAAYATFDPTQVIARHGPYRDVAGWFDVNSVAGRPPNDQTVAAETLCARGRVAGIDCAVVTQPGNHDWPFAAKAFAAALPWLAATVDTPGSGHVDLPGGPGAVA